ncbi:peptidoglycan D,D-transpeptidase FtsI family protein [Metabacillus fastidiosus]|uniref:peptidoglycan D,D-transpeptidase FtsI family protein n=2 Tax=Metabacillus fastidiosus TaxID=1458 RepID=UPI003D283FEE
MPEQDASASEQRKLKKKRYLRINIFFFIVFICFVALILRLGLVQIVYGEDYRKEVERTEDIIISNPVPRGKIYDRNGLVIVDNLPMNAITYTKFQKTTSKEMIQTAERLSKILELEEKDTEVKERDLKDYWITTRPEKAAKKITEKELKDPKLEDKDRYDRQIERITEKDLKEISQEELEIAAIFRNMNAGYALTPQIIKKNATEDEFSQVSEQLAVLPNVDITTDWNRDYPHKEIFRSVLGKVSSSTDGLPQERLDYFLSRGYNRNDRVGLSQLELYYEDLLHGKKAKIKNITDKGGTLLETETISEGERGKDLILSIDFELQIEIEKIIEEELRKEKARSPYADRAFLVMMNPYTGEVLSMAGKQLVRKNGKFEMNDFALGNVNTQYVMGSSIKGATILAGLQSGAISRSTVFYDGGPKSLYFSGTEPKGSASSSIGSIGIAGALKKSSNVYMFKTVLKMLGKEYYAHMSVPLKPEAVQEFRNSFSQLGLGVKTGIDLPNETRGQEGSTISKEAGLFLDLAIGQYDSYTPMQLAQYVSTIANNGYRIKPQLVKEIHEPSDDEQLGPVSKPFKPQVLNKVSMSDADLKAVQAGFRQVFLTGGTAYSVFGKAPYQGYQAAGKTGTAQSYFKVEGRKNTIYTNNVTLVGYAPYEKPEVAFSVVVPHVSSAGTLVNKEIGARALKAYYDLKEKRQSGQTDNGNEVEEQSKEVTE